MLSKKDKEQFERFCIVLYATALTLFFLAMITKFYVLTIVGWVALLSAWYIKFWYIPKNSKKKNSTVVTPEFSLSKYWDKFIEWLHT
jgi:hypothetical protein